MNRRRRPFQGRALPLSYLASVQTSVASLRVESGRSRKRRESPRTVRCNNSLSIPTPIPHAKLAGQSLPTRPSPALHWNAIMRRLANLLACLILFCLSLLQGALAAHFQSRKPAPRAPFSLRRFRVHWRCTRSWRNFPKAPTCTSTFQARSMRRHLSATRPRTACASTRQRSNLSRRLARPNWFRQLNSRET